MTDLRHLSFGCCKKGVPRVATNAERLQEYRRITQPEPINTLDWEAARKRNTNHQSAPIVATSERVVPIRRGRVSQ